MDVSFIKKLTKVFDVGTEKPNIVAGGLYRYCLDGEIIMITHVGEMINEHMIEIRSIMNGKIYDHPINIDWFSTRYERLS